MINQVEPSSLPPISNQAPQSLEPTQALPALGDDSLFSYFWNAGLLIKLIVIFLLCCSIYSWAIIIAKYFKLRRLAKESDEFEEEFWSGVPLDVLYKRLSNSQLDPMSNVFCAAMAEWELSNNGQTQERVPLTSLSQRIERAMIIAIKKDSDDLEKGLTFLSNIGTNCVLFGLVGTVLGILNGFKSIALQQSASISTVGPIISEALITTALGFMTAIPAAMMYNKFRSDIEKYVNRLEIFANEFCSIISRQYDRP